MWEDRTHTPVHYAAYGYCDNVTNLKRLLKTEEGRKAMVMRDTPTNQVSVRVMCVMCVCMETVGERGLGRVIGCGFLVWRMLDCALLRLSWKR